jgi:hypothetical protein
MQRKLTKKDKEAILAIDSFIGEIRSINELQTSKAWKLKVVASLENWLGKENVITVSFKEFEGINVLVHPTEFRPEYDHAVESRLNQIKDYIKSVGVIPQQKKLNFLCTIKKEYALIIIGLIISSVTFLITQGVANIRTSDYLILENKYNILIDSLRATSLKNAQIKNASTDNSSKKTNNNILKHDNF